MSSRIKRERDGVVVLTLGATEIEVVRGAFSDLLELFDSHQAESGPVAEIAPGIPDPFGSPGTGRLPDDPALARLLPDAYASDADAATEYRRFTENDLLAAKRANAGVVLAGLAEAERHGAIRLDGETVNFWLMALNDLRLVLGNRLDVQEDYEALIEQLEPDDPRLPGFALYEWLTALQETLLQHAL
ncbi:MAG TPA: DUF2017 domain-containing protein [Sporichthyaceae bacterium]|nr:DUF2017 domain-containing protein [Sporichthyaceae bacterium]